MKLDEILNELKNKNKIELSEDDSEKLSIYIEHLSQIIRRLDQEREIVYECSRIIREKL